MTSSNALSKIQSLDTAIVMSKLSTGVCYERVRTKRNRWQIVVINGIPFDFRSLCVIMIGYAAGGISGVSRGFFEDETIALWHDVGYKYEKVTSDWDLPIECINAIRQVMGGNLTDVDMKVFAQLVSQAMEEFTPS